MRLTARPLISALLLALPATTAVAQGYAPALEAPSDTGQERQAHKVLFTSRDAYLAAGFVGLTIAMFPLDRHLARTLRDSSLQTNDFLSNLTKGVETVTQPGALIIGATLYTVGRVGGWRDVADLGWHGTEAIIVSSAATAVLKGVLGRARP